MVISQSFGFLEILLCRLLVGKHNIVVVADLLPSLGKLRIKLGGALK